jgi:hypothetical protein
MFQLNNIYNDDIMDMDMNKSNEQLDYVENCALGVCYASIALLIGIVLTSHISGSQWLYYFSALFLHENIMIDILLGSFSIITIISLVFIVISTVQRITYKIDQKIIRLNEQIEMKNKTIRELEINLKKLMHVN